MNINRLLGDGGISPSSSAGLARQIAESGNAREAVDTLLDVFESGDPRDIRQVSSVFCCLGKYPETMIEAERAVPYLREAMQSPNVDVKETAASAVVMLDEHPFDREVIDAFIVVLKEHPNPEVREVAVGFLGMKEVRDSAAMEALYFASRNDPEEHIQIAAKDAYDKKLEGRRN